MAFSRQYCISEVRKLADNFQGYQLVSGVTRRWKTCGAILTNLLVSSLHSLLNAGGLICLEGLAAWFCEGLDSEGPRLATIATQLCLRWKQRRYENDSGSEPIKLYSHIVCTETAGLCCAPPSSVRWEYSPS